MTQADAAASTRKAMDEIGIPADAIARAVAFAIEQPANVDVNEIVVRPTAQG
jgi:NADP-dependent 3-hydroxy acid dehydrogenase YdfG